MSEFDPATLKAVRRFAELLQVRYHPLEVILFGSRARGTHRADSDADVAVILDGEPERFVATKLAMSDIAYDILLDMGVNISPLPVWLDQWRHPDRYSNPELLENIAREGIRL